MTDHRWPVDPQAHVWGPWLNKSWKKPKPPVQYRTCVHPGCKAVETREAARA